MTLNDFIASLNSTQPPAGSTAVLDALWYDGKGDWDKAHMIAQDIETDEGSLIHAYLHRKEGDTANASYWYHRAGRRMPKETLDQEWEALVQEFLA